MWIHVGHVRLYPHFWANPDVVPHVAKKAVALYRFLPAPAGETVDDFPSEGGDSFLEKRAALTSCSLDSEERLGANPYQP